MGHTIQRQWEETLTIYVKKYLRLHLPCTKSHLTTLELSPSKVTVDRGESYGTVTECSTVIGIVYYMVGLHNTFFTFINLVTFCGPVFINIAFIFIVVTYNSKSKVYQLRIQIWLTTFGRILKTERVNFKTPIYYPEKVIKKETQWAMGNGQWVKRNPTKLFAFARFSAHYLVC